MTRITYGLLFALPLGLVSAVWVQASPPGPQENPDRQCETCHLAVHQAWEDSHHGQAVTDPLFVESWQAQGEPVECLQCHTTGFDPDTGTWAEDGITCAACHSPVADGHPLTTMPTNRSAELCGTCHVETAFAWQVSAHAVNDLTCVTCHGQHSTNIKAGDPSALCVSCHLEVSDNFVHKQHSEEGLSCANCHLGPTGDSLGEGSAARDHSFAVVLTTCEDCHAYQSHPEDLTILRPSEESNHEFMPLEFETAGLNTETQEVNPLTFALLAALVGMAAGMILAPWIERWYHRRGN